MDAIVDLDANATTRLDPRVRRVVEKCLTDVWGNPSSENALGRRAKAEVTEARVKVAQLIKADESDILFTSGATESINLAIQGVLNSAIKTSVHIVTTMVEHRAVLSTLETLWKRREVDVTVLRPDAYGRVQAEEVGRVLRPNTRLVAIIHGNNEIGTVNPIEEIGLLLRDSPALYFVDAAQTLAYCPPSVIEAGIDLMSLSSHKMHGPKGIGALYLRGGISLQPLTLGGGQERGLRPGTLNVPGIAGFGTACEIAQLENSTRCSRVTLFREVFLDSIRHAIPDIVVNGCLDRRLPGNLNLTIPYVDAAMLIGRLPHISFSRGSACSSASGEPSHVLQSIGLTRDQERWTIRLGFSCFNTEDEVARAAKEIASEAKTIRGM